MMYRGWGVAILKKITCLGIFLSFPNTSKRIYIGPWTAFAVPLDSFCKCYEMFGEGSTTRDIKDTKSTEEISGSCTITVITNHRYDNFE